MIFHSHLSRSTNCELWTAAVRMHAICNVIKAETINKTNAMLRYIKMHVFHPSLYKCSRSDLSVIFLLLHFPFAINITPYLLGMTEKKWNKIWATKCSMPLTRERERTRAHENQINGLLLCESQSLSSCRWLWCGE